MTLVKDGGGFTIPSATTPYESFHVRVTSKHENVFDMHLPVILASSCLENIHRTAAALPGRAYIVPVYGKADVSHCEKRCQLPI